MRYSRIVHHVFGLICVCALSGGSVLGCGNGDPCEGVSCDDDNECTRDSCVDGMCEFAPVEDGTGCDDGDGNECTGICTSGVCDRSPVEDGTGCDDGSLCTSADVCVDGVCEGTPVEDGTRCDDGDGNACTGMCASGVCDSTPVEDGTGCDDGSVCTTAGMCVDGVCEGTPVEDGTACGGGAACQGGNCVGTFACTEQGVRDAIAVGGGPHTFDCNGPTTISTNREIVIGNDVILDGEGNLILDGQDNHRVLSVPSGSRVTLDGITVTRGYIDDGNGGGIANGGRLTLLNSAVKNSVARLTSRYLKRGYGGGIHNTETVTLINCTVSGNTARGTWQPPTWCWEGPCPDVFVGGDGGGIDNRKTLLLINSTVSENEAEGIGGGIYNQYGHVGRYTNSTISGNRALRGGAIYNNSGGTLTVTNTLVNGVCNEPYGAVVSNGYNVESPGDTCGFDQETDQVNVSAEELNLGRLADNGGPTMTHALLTDPEDSVAIDWIPAQDCLDADGAPLATDQRGEPRPVAILGAEPKCDVGAFEVQP